MEEVLLLVHKLFVVSGARNELSGRFNVVTIVKALVIFPYSVK